MKRVGGSALLWAVGVLAVMLLVIAGVLSLSESYAQTELREIAQAQALSYARAGIELTAEQIETDGAASGLIPSQQSACTAEIMMETGTCVVTIFYNGDENRLELSATAAVGDYTESLSGRMDAAGSGFRFSGFIGN